MIYGTTLGLPGKFSQKYIVDAHTDLDNYSAQLCVAMSRLRLCPPRDSPQKKTFSNIRKSTQAHMYFCEESQLRSL